MTESCSNPLNLEKYSNSQAATVSTTVVILLPAVVGSTRRWRISPPSFGTVIVKFLLAVIVVRSAGIAALSTVLNGPSLKPSVCASVPFLPSIKAPLKRSASDPSPVWDTP